MTTSSILEITNLSKKYGDKTILKNIQININEGKILVLIGQSGSGKSTLLKCLNFLEVPGTANYKLNGQNIQLKYSSKRKGLLPQTKDDKKSIQKTFGMIFQEFNLWPHMTCLENVTLPQTLSLKKKKKDAELASLRLLEKVGLKEHSQSYPDNLSGGQKQRVAIARSLGIESKVLLMDEPTSALDPKMTEEIKEIIKKLSDEGKTMLIFTHDLSLAEEIADYVIFMNDGCIVEQGEKNQIFYRPKTKMLQSFVADIN